MTASLGQSQSFVNHSILASERLLLDVWRAVSVMLDQILVAISQLNTARQLTDSRQPQPPASSGATSGNGAAKYPSG